MSKEFLVKIKNGCLVVCQFAIKLLFNIAVAIMAAFEAVIDYDTFYNKRDEIVTWLEKFKN